MVISALFNNSSKVIQPCDFNISRKEITIPTQYEIKKILYSMSKYHQKNNNALREFLFILREEVNKDTERLMKKFAQDQPGDRLFKAILDEEENFSEADALEMLALMLQTVILQDQLQETSEELSKFINLDSSLIEDLDPMVARIIAEHIDPKDADTAGTITEQKEIDKMNPPVENEIQIENEKKPPEDKFITRQDLLRIAKFALILSISLILPGFLYFAGLQIGWAIVLFVGYLVVAWLGYSIKR